MSKLRINDPVTSDKNWTGRITKIDSGYPLSEDGLYYWVHWKERENHAEAAVRRHPICGHLRQEIRRPA